MTIFFYFLQAALVFGRTFGVELLFLATMLLFSVLIAGALAPLNALGWWAGWSRAGAAGESAAESHAARSQIAARARPAQPPARAEHYIVYLSGIGDISGDFLNQTELGFVRALQPAMPRARIIHDIFAFSMTNVGLTEEALMGRFWRWMKRAKLRTGRVAAFGSTMINGRNLLQVAVSADRRYGPVFNYGTASMIFQHLLDVGFEPGCGVPVTLIGYSGGGQVVLASSQYLKPALGGPLQVISIGGVMSSSPGVASADEIIHLEGQHDPVQRVADYIFPGRWAANRRSAWNQALAAGKIRRIVTGPMTHSGGSGYYGAATHLPDGRSYLEHTVGLVRELAGAFRERHGPHPPAPSPARGRGGVDSPPLQGGGAGGGGQ